MNNEKQHPTPFDFDGLFIFELSKNHAGDVKHGLRTVREFAKVAKESGVRGAIKLQFQDLDSYIHPEQRASNDPRMKRYFSSRLSEKEFKMIIDEVHTQGLVSMSTPFDEQSVDMLERLGIQVIKIASSSSTDQPLIARVVESRKPVVCSTGGLRFEDTDMLYSFFKKNGTHFALMHCVSIYPTPLEHMQLHRIALMKKRYPDVPIGFSTHEPSDITSAVQIAYSLGARLFEKHVIIPDERLEGNLLYHKIRTYTATPEQAREWLSAYKEAVLMHGSSDSGSYLPDKKEIEILRTMTRGVFIKSPLKKGAVVTRENVYFAIPLREGQLSSGEWREGMIADKAYVADEAFKIPSKKKKGKKK